MEFNKAKKFIQKGEPQKAIEYLIELCLYHEKLGLFLDDLSVLSSEYKRHHKEISLLQLRKDEGDFNRINYAILDLINKMNQFDSEDTLPLSSAKIVDTALTIPKNLSREKGSIVLQDYNHKYFPTLDFKLQNVSPEKILLHQFHLELIAFDLDRRPELQFNFKVLDQEAKQISDDFQEIDAIYGDLLITVTNNGWGTAKDCHVAIETPFLDQYFKSGTIKWSGDLASNATQTIAQMEFSKIKKRVRKKIDLPTIEVQYSFLDEHNESYSNKDQVTLLPKNTRTQRHACYLTKKGFLLESSFLKIIGRVKTPEAIYISIVEPEQPTKSYPIAHEIPAKDFERFQIMIGAKQSATVKARIGFEFDDHSLSWTKPMYLKIHNPVNLAYHKQFYDAGEFLKKDDHWVLSGEKPAYGFDLF